MPERVPPELFSDDDLQTIRAIDEYLNSDDSENATDLQGTVFGDLGSLFDALFGIGGDDEGPTEGGVTEGVAGTGGSDGFGGASDAGTSEDTADGGLDDESD